MHTQHSAEEAFLHISLRIVHIITVATANENGSPVPMILLRKDFESVPQWKLAANILNKQPRTDNKGWSSRLGVGRGANNHSP
jgi:hypothetical protein